METSRSDGLPDEAVCREIAVLALAGDALTAPGHRGPFTFVHGRAASDDELLGVLAPISLPIAKYQIEGNYLDVAKTPEVGLLRHRLAKMVFADFRLETARPFAYARVRRRERMRIVAKVEEPAVILAALASEASSWREAPELTSAIQDPRELVIAGTPRATYVIDLRAELKTVMREKRFGFELAFSGKAYRRGRDRATVYRIAFAEATDDLPADRPRSP